MRTIQLTESAIDAILFVLNSDQTQQTKYAGAYQRIAEEICEQCMTAEEEPEDDLPPDWPPMDDDPQSMSGGVDE